MFKNNMLKFEPKIADDVIKDVDKISDTTRVFFTTPKGLEEGKLGEWKKEGRIDGGIMTPKEGSTQSVLGCIKLENINILLISDDNQHFAVYEEEDVYLIQCEAALDLDKFNFEIYENFTKN
jgi:hypothetical protein